MGVVNNAIYLRCFEVGRAEWLRQHGRTYKDLEALGSCCPVVEAHCAIASRRATTTRRRRTAARRSCARASLKFAYELVRERDGKLLVRRLDHATPDLRPTARSSACRRSLLALFRRLTCAVIERSKRSRWKIATSHWSWCASPRRPRSSCARWMGRGDAKGADHAAVDAMRRAFDGVRHPRHRRHRRGRARRGADAVHRRAGRRRLAGTRRARATRRVRAARRHRRRSARGHEPVRDRLARRDRRDRDRRRRQVPERARHLHGEDRGRPRGKGVIDIYASRRRGTCSALAEAKGARSRI